MGMRKINREMKYVLSEFLRIIRIPILLGCMLMGILTPSGMRKMNRE